MTACPQEGYDAISAAATTRADESRHELSGQRMMSMQVHSASGVASAHRYNFAPSTTVFKTFFSPFRIAVHAAIEKSMHSKENQPRFGAICPSLSADRCRILPHGAVTLRFPDYCRLKTEHSQPNCGLRFPYAACRCNAAGLPEQMP